jgi:AcrR family transcriptional regulator
MPRRDQLTDAAIKILSTEGSRRLTHRAVDARAGLAPGSASNVFRTRAALIKGVLNRLIERERAVLDALDLGPPAVALTETAAITLAAGMILDALGPGRDYTLARRALFADASHDPQIAEELNRASQFWWDVVAQILRGLGAPDADRRGRWLLAYLDGVISDQLARPQTDFDPYAAMAPAIYGIVSAPYVSAIAGSRGALEATAGRARGPGRTPR